MGEARSVQSVLFRRFIAADDAPRDLSCVGLPLPRSVTGGHRRGSSPAPRPAVSPDSEAPRAHADVARQPARARFSRSTLGCRAAMRSSARAGPSGMRLPCSQLRSVCTLIPRARANVSCDSLVKRRRAATSSPLLKSPRTRRSRSRRGIARSKSAAVSSLISSFIAVVWKQIGGSDRPDLRLGLRRDRGALARPEGERSPFPSLLPEPA